MFRNGTLGGVARAGRIIATWTRRSQDRARMRRELRSFDSTLFEDIGIQPADLWAEANKPFWRA